MQSPDWLQNLLEDPDVTDVCVNGTQGVFCDRGDGMELVRVGGTPAELPEPALLQWVLARLSDAGKTWDARYPFVDATLGNGKFLHRLHVAFPPMSPCGITVSLRRLSRRAVVKRWQNVAGFDAIAQSARRGESILISGSTGSGKTTLLCELLSSVPPEERIVCLEDTPELSPHHDHFVPLVSRPPNPDGFGEVSLRDLLRQALRMRPDRILLGECRGPEVLELLQALNTGHRGSLATIHANSGRDALRRIELLCLLAAGGSIASPLIRELIAAGLQWVVQVERSEGRRRISEVLKIEGKEGDTLLLRPMPWALN